MNNRDPKKGVGIIVSLKTHKGLKHIYNFPELVDTVSPQSLTEVHTMGEIGKTTSHGKVTWDTSSGNYTAKNKIEESVLKLHQLTQSREVTESFHLY